jgi:DNA-binding transcriptional LysR family regulator
MSLATIDAALEAARHQMGEVKGTLRVHGPVCLGESHLHRIVADFQKRYPNVSVELTLENRAVDLVHDNIDVAVRIGRPTEQSYILRKVGLIRRILVASPEYLSRHKEIRSPSALKSHEIIVTDAVLARQGTVTLVSGGQSIAVPVSPVLKTNNARVLISALLAGRGLGPVQVPLVIDELAAKQLVPVLPSYELKPSELYVIYPTARFLRPTVRSFIEFVGPALKKIEGIHVPKS